MICLNNLSFYQDLTGFDISRKNLSGLETCATPQVWYAQSSAPKTRSELEEKCGKSLSTYTPSNRYDWRC